LCFQVGASSGQSLFRLEHYQVRALSDAIFSSFAENGLCLSQVIASSGYCIFRLEPFLVMPFSGSEKTPGLLHFPLFHIQSPRCRAAERERETELQICRKRKRETERERREMIRERGMGGGRVIYDRCFAVRGYKNGA
jgi:hypothetical protein